MVPFASLDQTWLQIAPPRRRGWPLIARDNQDFKSIRRFPFKRLGPMGLVDLRAVRIFMPC
jgi:hypothetical protein